MIKELYKKLFNKKKEISIKDLEIGSFLKLEYKDPKTIGIISQNSLTCTRLNNDELINRKIQGFVITKYYNNDLRLWFIGIRACKKNGNQIFERDFLFLETEIKEFELLK